MTVNVGHLFKKRTMRKLDGTIYEMVDETNGGVIISKGKVVNQERVNEIARIEQDRRNSATAFANPSPAPQGADVEIRNVAPSKVEQMEKDITELKNGISSILEALKKK